MNQDRNFDRKIESSPPELNDQDPVADRQRLKLVLALVIVWIAIISRASANEQPCCLPLFSEPLQLDGFTPVDFATHDVVDATDSIAYADVYAELANFDADADADGWRVVVALRSRDGSVPTGVTEIMRARAVVGLMDRSTMVRPQAGRTGSDHVRRDRWRWDNRRRWSGVPISGTSAHFDSPPALPKWQRSLRFDAQGIAMLQLPASANLQRQLGWPTMQTRPTLHRAIRSADFHAHAPWGRLSERHRNRYFVTTNLRERIDHSTAGWIQIQVIIPGQNPVAALAPVLLRPSVLVDTSR